MKKFLVIVALGPTNRQCQFLSCCRDLKFNNLPGPIKLDDRALRRGDVTLLDESLLVIPPQPEVPDDHLEVGDGLEPVVDGPEPAKDQLGLTWSNCCDQGQGGGGGRGSGCVQQTQLGQEAGVGRQQGGGVLNMITLYKDQHLLMSYPFYIRGLNNIGQLLMSFLDNSVKGDSSLAWQNEDTETGEDDTNEEEDESPVSQDSHVTYDTMSLPADNIELCHPCA